VTADEPVGPVGPADPVAAAEAALARIAAGDRPEVWISRREPELVLAAAHRQAGRAAAGEDLPLLGRTVAAKGNIDVAGLVTTAGCPAYGYEPGRSAAAVARLEQAGAVVVGSTNLDQFATGLVGTRSPYGAVRSAVHPELIAGGSSSGSAVAVALGLVDLALGTDTAGSGRVPASMNGIVGLKPTKGWVSTLGVVPACRSLDCVSVFAPTVHEAVAANAAMAGFDLDDPWSRRPVPPRRPSLPLRIGVPSGADLDHDPDLDVPTRAALDHAADRLAEQGHDVVEISLAPLLAAGALLYGGAFVAERYAAVGEFIAAHLGEVDPTVGAIIMAGADVPAHRLAADEDRLRTLARQAEATWEHVDVLVLPTTPTTFTIDQVAEDPIGRNVVLGRYTSFVNLLDQCAITVPVALQPDGVPRGLTVIGPAWTDARVAAVGAELAGEPCPHGDPAADSPAPSVDTPVVLAVVGAHLTGQPLNHQLTDRGGTLLRSGTTSDDYRLYALHTEPPKPGLLRVRTGGQPIEVELWELSPAAFGDFVANIPAPLGIGRVRLDDGSDVAGFLCEPVAVQGAEDISIHGGWRRYLATRT
jgi:allophanate hydrolase